jgi:hypothetical protein
MEIKANDLERTKKMVEGEFPNDLALQQFTLH